MADVLIAAYGSRGDIMPLTDIACRLRDAGHEVVLTTNTDLVDDVQACGIHARPIDFQLDDAVDTNADPTKLAMQMVKPAGMRQLGRNFLAAVADVPADVVLLTPFTELAGHPFAQARSIPSIGLRLQPISATTAFPPTLLGAWSAGGLINRAAGRSAQRWFDRIYQGVLTDLRADLGLPKRGARALRRQRSVDRWPILHGFSPAVVPRPDDWRPGIDVVGYWWSQYAESWTPPNELTTFLAAGPPPIFVGLGSLMVSAAEAARLSAVIPAALDAAGVRGIVQTGGTDLGIADNDSLLTIGAAPHDWLFPQVTAAVHSCGAGTVAAGLRAGLPVVGVPSPGGDQPFWARRLQRLGVSPAAVPRPKLDADRLAAAITEAVTEPTYRDAARRLAPDVAADDGAQRVVGAVEQVLDNAARP